MDEMKRMFIVNPVAGRRKKPDRLVHRIRRICRESGTKFAIRIWSDIDQIDSIIAEAVRDSYDAAIACGGDGTVHAVGKRLIGTGIALGIVPSGSGNGYAGHLGFSMKYDEAIRQCLAQNFALVDTGVFGGEPFLNTAGIGMQAAVAEKFASSKTRGLKTYVKIGSQTFFKYKTYPVTLIVDRGEKLQLADPLLLDIMNGTEWGRGAKISPLSSIRDGKMTAVFLKKNPVVQTAGILRRLFQGTIHRSKFVTHIEGSRFEITRPSDGIAQVDGDPVHMPAKIICEIRRNSLKVLVAGEKTDI